MEGLSALDLRTTKVSGEPWDFMEAGDRAEARRMVQEDKPDWLIGSPPCTAFSLWQQLNFSKMTEEKVKRNLAEGRLHLRFMVSLDYEQIKGGRHVLHEHPQGAASWKEPCMAALLAHPRVDSVVARQCRIGKTSPEKTWNTQLVTKPTRFASTSPGAAETGEDLY